MTHRSYNQYCGLAYALDLIGERWTLLLIRELVAGPRRFKDLLTGLPGISTNLLAERLKELEQAGLLGRRVLPPPAGSTVYELTSIGQALEPTLLELGKWGSQFVPASADPDSVLRAGSYALTLKTFFRPEQAQGINQTYALHIDDEMLLVHIKAGTIDVQQGDPRNADFVLHSDVGSYLALLQGKLTPDAGLASGVLRIEGDRSALDRFLQICGLPGPELANVA